MADLEADGYLTRARDGRRTRYTVNHDRLFRHGAQEGHRVGPFLDLLAATGDTVPGPATAPDGRSATAAPGHEDGAGPGAARP